MTYLLLTHDIDPTLRALVEKIRAAHAKPFLAMLDEPTSTLPERPLEVRLDFALLEHDFLPIRNVRGGYLVSTRFLRTLDDLQVSSWYFPVRLHDTRLLELQEPLPSVAGDTAHFFWFPVRVADALDQKRSSWWWDVTKRRRRLTKPQLRGDFASARYPLFQPSEATICLANEAVRQAMEAASLRGVTFVPVEAAHWPEVGKALLRWEAAVEVDPTSATNWLSLASVLDSLHHPELALVAVNHALAQTTEDTAVWGEAWYRKGLVLEQLGRWGEALDAYDRSRQAQNIHLYQGNATGAWHKLIRKHAAHEMPH